MALRSDEALTSGLSAQAQDLGFVAMGVVRAGPDPEALERLGDFLRQGFQGGMAWLARDPARRADPGRLWPQVKSVILLGANYAPARDPLETLSAPDVGTISVYARNADYHDILIRRLKKLAAWLQAEAGGEARVFVDTAAIMEKRLAAAAGLGWQGKHTNLVSRRFGSWLFLGTLFTSLELPPSGAEADHCGSCRACLDVCPTEAFPAPYRLDARRCISYLTIEHKGPIPRDLRPKMGNRIYGCDDCLAVCPWNKFAQQTADMAFLPRAALTAPRLSELARLDDPGFRALFKGSPIKRIGRDRFVRNVLIALGNGRDEASALQVERLIGDSSPLVRGAAIWALGRLSPVRFADLRAALSQNETDPAVQAEWTAGPG